MHTKHKKWVVLLSLSLIMLMTSSISFGQAEQDDELKKKYAAIIGEYEFDLSEFGGEYIILEIHVDGGALWGDSGDGMPVTLEPYGENPYEFTATDPESGALEFKFLKNDKGEYTICQIALLDAGVEITGNKINR